MILQSLPWFCMAYAVVLILLYIRTTCVTFFKCTCLGPTREIIIWIFWKWSQTYVASAHLSRSRPQHPGPPFMCLSVSVAAPAQGLYQAGPGHLHFM